jgi:hypothetical protein
LRLRERTGNCGADCGALCRCRLSNLGGALSFGAVERLIDPGPRLLERGDPLALRRSELREPARRVGAVLRQLLPGLGDSLRAHVRLLARLDRDGSFDIGLGEPDRATCRRGRSCPWSRQRFEGVRVAWLSVVAGIGVRIDHVRGGISVAMGRVVVVPGGRMRRARMCVARICRGR